MVESVSVCHRCSSLVLSVSHLVILAKTACSLSSVLDWVDQSLADVEDHLQALREASISYEVGLHHNAAAGCATGGAAAAAGPASVSAATDAWEGHAVDDDPVVPTFDVGRESSQV